MMKKYFFIAVALIFLAITAKCQMTPKTISLNGRVDFEQTQDAFPPKNFTRKIPVPGMIDQASPKIDQYDLYFSGQQDPRYNWYRFYFDLDDQDLRQFVVLKVLKSFFNTQVIINGHDVGTYMQGSTPIDADLSPFVHSGKNILLLRLGERAWMPKQAATGFDREKYTDIPGIWDDIYIEISGPVKLHRVLALPSLRDKNVIAKVLLENYDRSLERNMEYSEIAYDMEVLIREKVSKKVVAGPVKRTGEIKCMGSQYVELKIPISNPQSWTPNHPFLYEMVARVRSKNIVRQKYGKELEPPHPTPPSWEGALDREIVSFGMRDFVSKGKTFYLNGKPVNLYGSTITLNRFFEDRNRGNLPWDSTWVEKLFIKIPKALKWNFFRVSIGILPKFWYDLADKYGIMIQNEYLMWNLRGRPEGYRKEYTDWIWSDGNHPSIVIWDALNEQKQDYIGKVLIPELKKIDPTRIWDLGYMKAEDVSKLEINEVHWYPLAHGWWADDAWFTEHMNAFRFGRVTDKYSGLEELWEATTPVIVNEFGWQWQSRDGLKSGVRTHGSFLPEDQTPYKKNYEYYEPDGSMKHLDWDSYDFFLGKGAPARERRDFQAYILSIESEIIRSTGQADGMATFAYLSNDRGYTGDWFADIKNLTPTPALICQYHTCRPFAVFLDVEDGRYLKNPKTISPASDYKVKLFVVNDDDEDKEGKVVISLYDRYGKVYSTSKQISVKKRWHDWDMIHIPIPEKEGGYMLISELYGHDSDNIPQISRRYIKVGESDVETWPQYQYKKPKNWPR